MGESERYQDYKHLRKKRLLLGQDNNSLMSLFTINVIFFLILMTVQVVCFFYQQTPEFYKESVVKWFELPASLTRLSERPWTLFTYMFSDTGANLWRLISNMLWLWAFGYILQEMTGNEKLIPIYIYGGLAGALFFIIANYTIPALKPIISNAGLMGANASVMAVASATTFLSPGYRFFTHIRKGIPIWVLLVFYVIIDFAGVASQNAAYSLSHLGGGLAGYCFVFFLRRGKDGSIWMNSFYHWLINIFTPGNPSEKDESIKSKLFYNTGNKKPFQKSTEVNQQRIDEIIDKINSTGFHFLTNEEKEFLKKASEDDKL